MIGRIDQAVLLLQDRLERLAKNGKGASGLAASQQATDNEPIERLRALRKRGQLGRDELRRAFVRSLLVESLGTPLAGSLDFQAISDQVAGILSDSEAGRALLDRALAELSLG